MKKLSFAVSLSAGLLLFAGTALAVANAPAASGSKTPTSTMMQSAAQAQSGALNMMPCPMMDQPAMGVPNMMYRQWPCGPTYYPVMRYGFGRGFSGEGAWLALMVIITVIMVWVVLLLLICVLIHWLKQHRNHK